MPIRATGVSLLRSDRSFRSDLCPLARSFPVDRSAATGCSFAPFYGLRCTMGAWVIVDAVHSWQQRVTRARRVTSPKCGRTLNTCCSRVAIFTTTLPRFNRIRLRASQPILSDHSNKLNADPNCHCPPIARRRASSEYI